ncbi:MULTISPECIES: isochorismatase family protein [unclassified Gilliamella]|uniref:isochorismatase family protein n=1 Tax=unclassified Gilliamella TaxID=2685620 RepID=UPI001C400479|nr:isochorismatase family protein [Gilliamella apicola]
MPKVAMLTNDLQYEFTYKISKSPEELEEKLTKFNEFLNGIRNLNHQVIHLQLINDPNDPAVQKRYKNREGGLPALAGRPENQILKTISHPSDIVVVKGRDTGFYNNDLDGILKKLGVNSVIVTGACKLMFVFKQRQLMLILEGTMYGFQVMAFLLLP